MVTEVEVKEKERVDADVEAETEEKADVVIDGDFSVCFVCTGNTCRSPMAEAVMKSRGVKGAFSRGLAAYEGDPISDNAVSALVDAGIESTPDNDYTSHRAKNISDADMARADAVFCMTSAHASRLFFAYPQYASKIHVMPREISDPYGGDLEKYKKTLAEIISAIAEIYPDHA